MPELTLQPGHFGHLNLESPCFHVGFLNEIYKLAQCVCINCGRLRADKKDADYAKAMKLSGKRRMHALLVISKGKNQCVGDLKRLGDGADGGMGAGAGLLTGDFGCGARQPKFKREGLKIILEFPDTGDDSFVQDKRQLFTPARAFELFRQISDESVRILGFNPQWARPEWCAECGPSC